VQAKFITKQQMDDMISFFSVPTKKNATMFAIMTKKYAMMCHIIIALFTTTSWDRNTAFSFLKPNKRMTQDVARDKLSKNPKIIASF
jgi:hypothetical protein